MKWFQAFCVLQFVIAVFIPLEPIRSTFLSMGLLCYVCIVFYGDKS